MDIAYVKEFDESLKFKERICLRLRSVFGIVKEETVDGKLFFVLPITKKDKLNKKRIKKLAKCLNKILYKKDIEDVVLSNYLYNISLFKNLLYGQNVSIFDGKKLFKYMIYNILKYIYDIKEVDEKNEEVSILINDLTSKNMQNIIFIANKVKRINIITNHINSFKSLEEKLYNEFGIVITVSNNKKKSLIKSNMVINFDFPNELINKYNINNNAIIINIPNDIKINSKKFNGILINDFKIDIPSKYKIEGFKNEIIYESIVFKKDFISIQDIILKEKITIKKLIGENGEINKNELIQ